MGRIEVNTNQYQFSHGKLPKGFGFWAFEIAGETRLFQGSYAGVKKQAVAEAKAKGASRIAVLP